MIPTYDPATDGWQDLDNCTPYTEALDVRLRNTLTSIDQAEQTPDGMEFGGWPYERAAVEDAIRAIDAAVILLARLDQYDRLIDGIPAPMQEAAERLAALVKYGD